MAKPYFAETLSIDGPDAVAFAHAQFSSNVLALAIGQWQFSAWLDPQGRVRAFFHIARTADDRLLLLLRGGSATEMVASLQRFVFRSRLKLTALAPRALSTGPSMPAYAVRQERENLWLGCDTHSLMVCAESGSDETWRLLQLRAGWPWLPDSLLNTLLSPALSLQRLHAVAIDKGCYPGQEIVARMHFRGGSKKHLHRVEISSSQLSTRIFAGEPLRIDTHEKGCLLDVCDSDIGIEALAVLNDDVVARAADGRLDSFDEGLTVSLCETWSA